MDLSDYAAHYARIGDDELLCLWVDRDTLVTEAAMALDNELIRRGLDKQSASRIKKRLDALAAREVKGPLMNQIAEARYERDMRHFVGWQEPKFYSSYGGRDIRNTFAHIRHKYRVWKTFRDHTGHWPVFSIVFPFLSWIAFFGFCIGAFVWIEERKWNGTWSFVAVMTCLLAAFGVRDLGTADEKARLEKIRYVAAPVFPSANVHRWPQIANYQILPPIGQS
jgi:hypothetical protein